MSKVVQLRQRIEQEIIAMRFLMNGPAIVSRHAFITHKYRNLGAYSQKLAGLVGEQQAKVIVNKAYDQIMEVDEQCNNAE